MSQHFLNPKENKIKFLAVFFFPPFFPLFALKDFFFALKDSRRRRDFVFSHLRIRAEGALFFSHLRIRAEGAIFFFPLKDSRRRHDFFSHLRNIFKNRKSVAVFFCRKRKTHFCGRKVLESF